MLLLLLKVVLQILSIGLAVLVGGLDYWWHDKRTRHFKHARQAFIAIAIVLVLASIGWTVFDDVSTQTKEKEMRSELVKVQKQNDGLQAGIAALGVKSSDILTEQRNSFVSVLGDQRSIGLETAGKIQVAADTLQVRIRETTAKQRELLVQQKATIANITGGNSFCYMRMILGSEDAARVILMTVGKEVVYDITIRMWDPDNYKSLAGSNVFDAMKNDLHFEVGNMSPGVASMRDNIISLPTSGTKTFALDISARNGMVQEVIELRKFNGEWKASYKVIKYLSDGKGSTLLLEEDPSLKGKIKW